MKATLFDYGAGNLHSLSRALALIGVEATRTEDPQQCRDNGDLLVLPGVGNFGLAAKRLAPVREDLAQQLRDGRPCIGICLGMQLFFEESDEAPGDGLGLLAGRIDRLRAVRVPHIGWTPVDGLTEMYFAHTYVARPDHPEVVRAWANHEGDRIAAIVASRRTIGVQFHPEKSSTAGLALLRELVSEVTR